MLSRPATPRSVAVFVSAVQLSAGEVRIGAQQQRRHARHVRRGGRGAAERREPADGGADAIRRHHVGLLPNLRRRQAIARRIEVDRRIPVRAERLDGRGARPRAARHGDGVGGRGVADHRPRVRGVLVDHRAVRPIEHVLQMHTGRARLILNADRVIRGRRSRGVPRHHFAGLLRADVVGRGRGDGRCAAGILHIHIEVAGHSAGRVERLVPLQDQRHRPVIPRLCRRNCDRLRSINASAGVKVMPAAAIIGER